MRSTFALTTMAMALALAVVGLGTAVVLGCSQRVVTGPSPRSESSATPAVIAGGRDEKAIEGLLASLASADPTKTRTLDREIRLLSATDPKRFVHSVAPQIPGARNHISTALREFDAVYDSRGARSAFDALVAAATSPPETRTVGRDADLHWLSPSVISMSELFRRPGTLSGSLPLRSIEITGTTATVTYGLPGETPVVLQIDLGRDPAGNLVIVALRGLQPNMLQNPSVAP
jgi:hypothetical protein